MKRHLICGICFFSLLSFIPGLSLGGEPEYVMKIAVGNPGKDYYHGWTPFVVFKSEVESRSNGRLKVQLYPLTLGKSSADMLAEVKEGIVQARDFADGHFASLGIRTFLMISKKSLKPPDSYPLLSIVGSQSPMK